MTNLDGLFKLIETEKAAFVGVFGGLVVFLITRNVYGVITFAISCCFFLYQMVKRIRWCDVPFLRRYFFNKLIKEMTPEQACILHRFLGDEYSASIYVLEPEYMSDFIEYGAISTSGKTACGIYSINKNFSKYCKLNNEIMDRIKKHVIEKEQKTALKKTFRREVRKINSYWGL